MASLRALFVFGTRPEAIKLCPVIRHMRAEPDFNVQVCVTAQHREMLDQALNVFEVRPDYDLSVMQPGQTLFESTSRILAGLEPVLAGAAPDIVLVQGDTTTTMCAAMAGFYARIPVAHVEAGLRTGDVAQPFPEEMNRLLTTRLSTFHFAATEWAASNLRAEGVPDSRICVTGQTGIDAVLHVRNALDQGSLHSTAFHFDPERKLIVVTAHRRENFGPPLESICRALSRLARRPDVEIAFPVHPNPNVRHAVETALSGHPHIHLLEPQPYVDFVGLMSRAYILITDSGGIQEEAPSLGKPVLVLRNTTERPEAVEAGTVELTGPNEDVIVSKAERLLDCQHEYRTRAFRHNPYGDGRASTRIVERLRQFLRCTRSTA